MRRDTELKTEPGSREGFARWGAHIKALFFCADTCNSLARLITHTQRHRRSQVPVGEKGSQRSAELS